MAVSTGGASPALASWLRDRVADTARPGHGRAGRAALEEHGAASTSAARAPSDLDWRALLDGPLPELVRAGRRRGRRSTCLVKPALAAQTCRARPWSTPGSARPCLARPWRYSGPWLTDTAPATQAASAPQGSADRPTRRRGGPRRRRPAHLPNLASPTTASPTTASPTMVSPTTKRSSAPSSWPAGPWSPSPCGRWPATPTSHAAPVPHAGGAQLRRRPAPGRPGRGPRREPVDGHAHVRPPGAQGPRVTHAATSSTAAR